MVPCHVKLHTVEKIMSKPVILKVPDMIYDLQSCILECDVNAIFYIEELSVYASYYHKSTLQKKCPKLEH